MHCFSIELEKATLKKNARGKITGGISIRVGNLFFPERGWNDFVFIILQWWLEAANGILKRSEQVVSLRFMDGPYRAELTAVGANIVRVDLLDEHDEPRLLGTCSVTTQELCSALIDAVITASNTVHENGWESADVLQLMGLANALKLQIESYK
jgi:hypothetical protein